MHRLFTTERGLPTKAAAKQEEQAATATILRRVPIMVIPRDDASALERRLLLARGCSKPFLGRPRQNNATESYRTIPRFQFVGKFLCSRKLKIQNPPHKHKRPPSRRHSDTRGSCRGGGVVPLTASAAKGQIHGVDGVYVRSLWTPGESSTTSIICYRFRTDRYLFVSCADCTTTCSCCSSRTSTHSSLVTRNTAVVRTRIHTKPVQQQ